MSVHPVNLAQLTDEVRANRAASREPLTRERSRAWLDADADRIGDVETYRVGDEERAALYALLDDVDDQRMWRALSSLLVDAAAGRVR